MPVSLSPDGSMWDVRVRYATHPDTGRRVIVEQDLSAYCVFPVRPRVAVTDDPAAPFAPIETVTVPVEEDTVRISRALAATEEDAERIGRQVMMDRALASERQRAQFQEAGTNRLTPGGTVSNLPSMPATSNTVSRSRRPRTGSTTRVDELTPEFYWQRSRFQVTCETHGYAQDTTHGSRTAAITAARESDRWCPSCTLRQENPRHARRAARNTTARLGLNRRFGVEIEMFGVDRHTIRRFLETTPGLSGWRVKGDCSIRGANGNEVVSPPLQGQAGMDQLRQVLAFLRERGGQVNRSCGGHIHLEARDMQAEGIVRFVESYHAHQDLIDFLVAPSRRGDQTYCGRYYEGEIDSMKRNHASRGYLYGERYKNVNVTSFGRHGTVEIRQHQGTLNFNKFESWILMCMAIADNVMETTQPLTARRSLRDFFRALDLDEDAASFLLGRALQNGAAGSQLGLPAEPVAA